MTANSFRRFINGQILWFLLVLGLWVGWLYLLPMDPDYTSGELLDHVLAWKETGILFSPPNQAPYRILNYPPLFLWMTREASQLGLSVLAAGRTLNLAAFTFCSLLLFIWINKESGSKKWSLGITALMATSFPLMYSVGQFHLELLAFSFTLLGFFLIRDPRRFAFSILSGIFIGLGCFVKQTQVIFALIALFWLLRYFPFHAMVFFVSLSTTGILGSLWLHHSFGEEVWRQLIIYTVGQFSLQQGLRQFLFHFLPWSVFFFFVIISGLNAKLFRRSLSWWFLIGSSVWLISAFRIGSGSQYFIEWSFAILLVLGGVQNQPALLNKFWKVLLLGQIIVADVAVALLLGINLKNVYSITMMLPKICDRLPSPPALVPAEEIGLLRACGRLPALHPFIITQLAQNGLWDESPFIDQLGAGNYPSILLPLDPKKDLSGVHQDRWTQNMWKEIGQHYQVEQSWPGFYLLKFKN